MISRNINMDPKKFKSKKSKKLTIYFFFKLWVVGVYRMIYKVVMLGGGGVGKRFVHSPRILTFHSFHYF